MNRPGESAMSERRQGSWQARLHEVIFEADTRAGKIFDVALLSAILLSVLAVMLESIGAESARYGAELRLAEWIFTAVFTVEYVLRLISVRRPLRYVFSFFGLVDLLSFLPSYLSLLVPGMHSLMVVRTLRLLRIFRVFKLTRYVGEANVLTAALRAVERRSSSFSGRCSPSWSSSARSSTSSRARSTASPASRSRSTGRS